MKLLNQPELIWGFSPSRGSDGTTYDTPKPYKKAKTKLAKIQWRNRNKQLGNRKKGIRASKNAHKYYRKLQKNHARIANQRRDFLQKTTTEISLKYAHIRIEDLNVQGMMANRKLSTAIADLGFYEFRRQLDTVSEKSCTIEGDFTQGIENV